MDVLLGDFDKFRDKHRGEWNSILMLARSSLLNITNDNTDLTSDRRERYYGCNDTALKGHAHEGNEASFKGQVQEDNETIHEYSAMSKHAKTVNEKTGQRLDIAPRSSSLNKLVSPLNVFRPNYFGRGPKLRSHHSQQASTGSWGSKLQTGCSLVCLLLVTGVVMFDDIFNVMEESTPALREMSHQVYRHGRKIMHAVNLLHNTSLIERCLILNPLYSLDWVCHDCLKTQNMTNLSTEKKIVLTNNETSPRPHVVETTLAIVTMSKLQDTVAHNYQKLGSPSRSALFSNVPDIQDINDLAKQENVNQLTGQWDAKIIWTPDSQMSKEMLRNLFPITTYISSIGFTSRNMTLILFNKATNFEKLSEEETKILYTQGQGFTKIYLAPAIECYDVCRDMVFSLEPGNIVGVKECGKVMMQSTLLTSPWTSEQNTNSYWRYLSKTLVLWKPLQPFYGT